MSVLSHQAIEARRRRSSSPGWKSVVHHECLRGKPLKKLTYTQFCLSHLLSDGHPHVCFCCLWPGHPTNLQTFSSYACQLLFTHLPHCLSITLKRSFLIFTSSCACYSDSHWVQTEVTIFCAIRPLSAFYSHAITHLHDCRLLLKWPKCF